MLLLLGPSVVDIPSIPGVSTFVCFHYVVGVPAVFMLLLGFPLLLGFCCCWNPLIRKQICSPKVTNFQCVFIKLFLAIVSFTQVTNTGGNDTGNKLAARVIDTGGNLPPVRWNRWPKKFGQCKSPERCDHQFQRHPVVHLVFDNFRKNWNHITILSRNLMEDDSWKKMKLKISWHTVPLKLSGPVKFLIDQSPYL